MRRFALLLVFIFLFVLSGCSSTPVEIVPIDLKNSDTTDLYGYECTMYFCPGYQYDEDTLFWYKLGTRYYDMAKGRLSDIEKELNCTIKTVYFDSESKLVSKITSTVAASLSGADVTSVNLYSTVKDLCQAGMFLPLDDFENLIPFHDEAVYGPANIQEPALFNGHPYMVIPYTHPERQLLQDYFLTFNETLLSAYNVPDLRAVYEQKKWTWDYFREFLSDYTVQEGGSTIVYGLSGCYLPAYVLASNGYEFAFKDDTGNYVSGTDTVNVLQTIDFLRELKTNFKDCIRYYDYFEDAIELMISGNAFMCTNEISGLISTIQYKVERFGVLPFPYGPSGEYGKSYSDSEIYGSGLNVTSNDPESAAIILNAYCQPFDEYPTAEDALEIYNSMFFDSRDITTLKDLTRTVRYRSWGGEGLSTLVTEIESSLMSKSSQEIISSIEGEMEEIVKEYVLPNVNYVETYFSE